MHLTPAEIAAKKILLAEAEKAYHGIMTGGGVRVLSDQNGERVEFGSANRLALVAYINQLRADLGMCPMGGVVARPMGVFL
jgi:hypothetical protein